MREWFARPLLAVVLATSLAFSPFGGAAFAKGQDPAQNPPQQNPPQNPSQYPTPQITQTPPPSNPAPKQPPIPVSLGVSKFNYAKGPRWFPNLIKPYEEAKIPYPVLVNSPRVEQLIHDGKLELGLQDAVELALENSMDIAVQRYVPWFADTSILRADGGGTGFNVAGAVLPFSTAIPNTGVASPVQFDPFLVQNVTVDSRVSPVNNPLTSGTGTATTAAGLASHTTQFNTQYQQGFATGANIFAAWNNTRASSTSNFNFFNPDLSSSLIVGFSQQLLNGFGFAFNKRNIHIAKNNRKIADAVLEQQVITTVTSTITAYWELVYARENVRVEEQAVAVSEKFYNDNKKQLEIGTMAPLDVVRAEAQLATDRQNLILAKTTQLQDEQTLKNAITKDPLAPNLVNVEIVPTELPDTSVAQNIGTFEDAIKEAFVKRPDIRELELNIKNAQIDTQANKNALLPTLTLLGQYGSFGLAGNSPITTATAAAGQAIVGANAQPVTVLDSTGAPVQIFLPTTNVTRTGTTQAGFTTAQNQIFHNKFPDYNVQINLQVLLRNRVAQASSEHAILFERQLEATMQQTKNAALLDVRNTYIALEQDRARVEAASSARELQRQTFEAEQKKYALGASTVYNVILTQRDYVTAQGTELRALADLVEAKANFERAVGRTMEVNKVTLADAKTGDVQRDTLIPGTLHGRVVGTDEIFNKEGYR